MRLHVLLQGFGGQLLAFLVDLGLEWELLGFGLLVLELGEGWVGVPDLPPQLDDLAQRQCLLL